MLPIQTTYLRPRTFIFIIPLVFCIGVFIIFGTQKNIPLQTQYIFLIPVGILVLVWLGFKKTQLIIDNEGLIHKTIFSTKQLAWSEVQKTYIKYQSHGKSGSHYWFFELSERRIKFSIGLYSRNSIRTIAEAVIGKCKHAAIEDRINNMAEGRFPWYIF